MTLYACLYGNGVVGNVIDVDPEFVTDFLEPSGQWASIVDIADVDPQPWPGWTYDDSTWTPPTGAGGPPPAQPFGETAIYPEDSPAVDALPEGAPTP